MIDERHEELAALYALDLLEGAELAQFEAALARDPALQTLVRELRDASTALAQAASLTPPAALKDRVLASIADRAPAAPAPARDNVIRTSAFTFRRMVPWAIAASLALAAAWLGQRYLAANSEATHLRHQQALADIALQSVRQQLEAERIVTRRQVQDLDQQFNAASTQLAQARSEVDRITTQLASTTTQAADRARQLAAAEQQLGEARTRVADREREVASLTKRIDGLAGASVELGRQLDDAKVRIATLSAEIVVERDLANYKISVLASLAKDQPQALAVAVWDPAKKTGVLKVEKLPALAANQDYQLWIVDPQYKDPVDGGVFTVDPATGATRVSFSAKQPVTAVNAFAISRERKGGVPKAEGPIVLLGK
ncbi:MAG: anti-sigma factor [Verrucomicrobiota bacterium]